ncbi:hypothetical protein [Calycomorphotria hydatis]|uniref:Uncharacterized protein n=1 Tax=Calycomorphotria hydatis TaxID=2528027 RepID=A0A517TCB0_9PLAN|nr:hypothetical protein [Calycomorphotria hydatis]QDT66007.1 hypothetical protein V22_32710 [Calycomorphotria hydatis]
MSQLSQDANQLRITSTTLDDTKDGKANLWVYGAALVLLLACVMAMLVADWTVSRQIDTNQLGTTIGYHTTG